MPKDSVKLGLMPPLTGLVGIYGTEIARAGQIACQEVNDKGGVLGRPLELVIEDDGSLPESAVASAMKLTDEHGCVAIIGNLLSNSRIAVAYRVAEPRKIPYLNFSFYEGSILSRYFFHYAALPNQQIDKMIPYMRKKYGPRMFFAGNNYEWPRGSIDAAKLVLQRVGGETIGEEYTDIGVPVADIDALLDKVEAARPDVFVPYFAGADQVNLLTRFTERGMKARMAVVMGHYDELMASKLSPEIRDGFYSSNTYFMTVETQENTDFLKRLANWQGVTGVWPEGNGILTNFGEGTYVCVKAFAKAANLAGSLDPEALVDALNTLKVRGPQGELRMDPVTHHARVNTYLSRCNAAGVFEIVERFGAIDPVIPERYKHQRISHQATLEDDIRLQARMLEQMSEGVMLIDSRNEQILYVNTGVETLFGYDKDELLGKLCAELDMPHDDSNPVGHTDISAILSHQGSWQGELYKRRKDGAAIWCAASFSVFTHPVHGEVWLAVYNDVSGRKRAEEKNQQLSERLNLATRSAHLGIWDWNIIKNELTWDERMFELYGVERAEFSGAYEAWIAGLHPEDRAYSDAAVQDALQHGTPYDIDFRVVWPDGSVRYIKADGQVICDAEGRPIRMTGINYDITDRKLAETELTHHRDHLEELVKARTAELQAANEHLHASLTQLSEAQTQLVQAEKMASLGELVAGVAHEISTPVGVGVTAVSYLQMKVEEYEQRYQAGQLRRDDFEAMLKTAAESGNIIHQNLNRAADLIRSFKQVAVDQTSNELRSFNLKDYLHEILHSLNPRIKSGGYVVKIDGPDDIVLFNHPGALSQIMTNLVMNSIVHGFDGRSSGSIRINMTEKPTGEVCLDYSDDGKGIAAENVLKIFDPFFTTKRGKGGSGLGMHIVYNLVNQTLGGKIECSSIEGEGATFHIELPSADRQEMLHRLAQGA